MDNTEIHFLVDEKKKTSLFDRVCSWSIEDILNKDLYKQQLKTIPDTFTSVDEYFNCFVPHLLEETRTELFSSFRSLAKAPVFQIVRAPVFQIMESTGSSPINNLLHDITITDEVTVIAKYKPECGDVIALSLTKEAPRRIDDLSPLRLAYVVSVYGDHSSDPNRVLDIIRSAKLNSSQEAAILGCIKARRCNHRKSMKLIWGPPGTGKTKTVATLLVALSKLK
ncbi:unnamed protein product [Microthlaspi erraticum]|uniref:DNA2/NAM7 helicase helicase domain-containing protein n=1 Tax=Microthlaspi erraticum TaxID=1685480 RepID=A0A6D2KUP5_9BRAS|nr:unnamed protein product [Microthlaspi erraticum]